MSVPRRLSVSLARLARFLHAPRARKNWRLHTVGSFSVLEPERPADAIYGRWLTILALDQRFLLLVDEFHAQEPTAFALALQSTHQLRGGRGRYQLQVERERFAVLPLGDYATEHAGHHLIWRQQLGHGRFLVGISRDLSADVRVLNGWAVERRSAGRVEHLLFANRARRLRPLGPIQTDALFGVAGWGESAGPMPTGFGADLLLVQATQLQWQPNGKLFTSEPFNLQALGS